MKRNLLAGFTLIELMVVIAIIGTLSSIVLSSLTTARGKGNDAAIKQDLAEMPAAVELKRIESSDLGFVGNQSNRYEYTLACSTTPSTANDSGALFRDAASKTSSTLNSAVCSTNAEPIPPYPLSAGGLTLNSKYYIDASGMVLPSRF
jgi:prepilin-type N-terminal cleavage/methylation domain-containing protein